MSPTVWTPRRKWLGNLIPALIWTPLTAAGVVWMIRSDSILGPGLGCIALATVLAWCAVNQFGLFQNQKMRRQLSRIIESSGGTSREAVFVGIATPQFSSAIDPHEDVGFLYLGPDAIRFVSETRKMEIGRDQLRLVRFRPNVHTFIGLGRWISLEGESDGHPIRLQIEPRERRTLLGNLRYSSELRRRIKRWLEAV